MTQSLLDALAKKVGGRFRLTSMLQKRLLEMNRGSRPLIDGKFEHLLDAAIQEADQNRIMPESRATTPVTEMAREEEAQAIAELAAKLKGGKKKAKKK